VPRHHPHRLVFIIFAIAILSLIGAGVYWYLNPEPGPLTLSRASFFDLKGWADSDPSPALAAFQRSCQALAAKPDSEAMGTYGGTLADWRPACAAAQKADPKKARAFFATWFTPVAVTAGRVEQGRFTGYYEPEIKGSRTRQGAFQVPVYGKPDDLIQVDLGAFRPNLAGDRIAGRLDGMKLVPYASRAEIAAVGLRHAAVLFYTDDKVELFFLHIQGSGRVMFPDGSSARVAYAAQNGQPYTAIGKTLIARGVPKDGMSLQVIRDWLKAHPADTDAVMNADASYVFFSEEPVGDPALGAKGAEGVPLTPKASLAVDTRLHGLGTPFFVTGPAPLGRLLIAQDIGGAIRGVIRGDVYFGYGAQAEAEAGIMNQTGRLYALLPKPVVERLARTGTFK
jgi:membrane-bound lytic murein transglycosylase A